MSKHINLDGMTEMELLDFWERWSKADKDDVAAFLGKRKNCMSDMKWLCEYASKKYVAMYCRSNGDISTALMYEKICDDVYKKIPKDLQW